MSRNIAAPNKPRKPLIRLRMALVFRWISTARSNGDSAGFFSALPEKNRGTRAVFRPSSGTPSHPEDRL